VTQEIAPRKMPAVPLRAKCRSSSGGIPRHAEINITVVEQQIYSNMLQNMPDSQDKSGIFGQIYFDLVSVCFTSKRQPASV